MRCLVTGAAGFIGAALCRRLLLDGYEVVGIDDYDGSLYDPKLKHWRVEQLMASLFARRAGAFIFQHVDVLDRGTMKWLDSMQGPFDVVFHMAARPGVRASFDDPNATWRVNTEGTLNVLELCRRSSVPRVVVASSSSVYSDEQVRCNPSSPYAASKMAVEQLAELYAHEHKLNIAVMRYFTVYGPAGRPDMAVGRFIRQMMRGEPVQVHGTGRQRRAFTYIDDVVTRTVKAGEDMARDGSLAIEEVSGPMGHSILELIEELKAKGLECHSIVFDPDPVPRGPVCSPTQVGMGIFDGLRRTVEWYKAHRELICGLEDKEGSCVESPVEA